jgi:hypothetical protein
MKFSRGEKIYTLPQRDSGIASMASMVHGD